MEIRATSSPALLAQADRLEAVREVAQAEQAAPPPAVTPAVVVELSGDALRRNNG